VVAALSVPILLKSFWLRTLRQMWCCWTICRRGHIENISEIRDKVTFIEGDIRDEELLEAAMAGTDVVFHEAALVSVFESVEDPCETTKLTRPGS
jgi:UDP-glucose 4-epimerase